MLFRPQTYWILFSIVAGVLTFEFPVASESALTGSTSELHLDAASSVLLMLLTLLLIIVSGITITVYANLNRQKSVCRIGIVLGVVLCFCYLSEWRNMGYPKLVLSGFFSRPDTH